MANIDFEPEVAAPKISFEPEQPDKDYRQEPWYPKGAPVGTVEEATADPKAVKRAELQKEMEQARNERPVVLPALVNAADAAKDFIVGTPARIANAPGDIQEAVGLDRTFKKLTPGGEIVPLPSVEEIRTSPLLKGSMIGKTGANDQDVIAEGTTRFGRGLVEGVNTPEAAMAAAVGVPAVGRMVGPAIKALVGSTFGGIMGAQVPEQIQAIRQSAEEGDPAGVFEHTGMATLGIAAPAGMAAHGVGLEKAPITESMRVVPKPVPNEIFRQSEPTIPETRIAPAIAPESAVDVSQRLPLGASETPIDAALRQGKKPTVEPPKEAPAAQEQPKAAEEKPPFEVAKDGLPETGAEIEYFDPQQKRQYKGWIAGVYDNPYSGIPGIGRGKHAVVTLDNGASTQIPLEYLGYEKVGEQYVYKPQEKPAEAPKADDQSPPVSPEPAKTTATAETAPKAGTETGEVSTTSISGKPVVEFPVDKLKLSNDVPNFKGNADETTGVVAGQKLEGKYERLGTAPIVAWERTNGDVEVITGRHRLDLARRVGEKTIPVQIVKESDGFTKDMALIFDSEANIRDSQGGVEDYAHYFRNSKITEAEARARGLRGRAKSDSGWHLGKDASDDLYALYQDGKIPEAKAVVIARSAPGNPDLQGMGIQQALKGKSPQEIENFIKAVGAMTGGKADQLDMFGRNDAALLKAEEMAKKASEKQKEIASQIKAVQGAARNPVAAAKLGVNVKDPQGVLKRIDSLKAELERWQNWALHQDLIAEVGGQPKSDMQTPAAEANPQPKPAAGGELFGAQEMPFNLSGDRSPEVKPKEQQVGWGEHTGVQQEMFALAQIVESKDPFKSADAAQKLYGGSKQAAEKIRKQLSVVDADKDQRKAFKKEQRERLSEVLNLLEQRAKEDIGPAAVGAARAASSDFPEGTGLKHAIDDMEREVYGFKYRPKQEKQDMAKAWVRSELMMEQKPTAGRDLATALIANPKRGLTGDESALLLRHKVALENTINDAAEKTITGTASEKAEANVRLKAYQEELEKLMDAIAIRGSEWGREGRWRQALAKEDYSFATQSRLLAAAKGRPLTEPENAALKQQLADLQSKMEVAEKSATEANQRVAEHEAARAIAEIRAAQAEAAKPPPEILRIVETIGKRLDARADAALARLRARTGMFNAGVDPTILKDLAEIGAARMWHTGYDIAKWSAKMVSDLGEKVKPYLQEIYDASKKLVESESDRLQDKKKAETVKRTVKQVDPLSRRNESIDKISKKVTEGKSDEIHGQVQKLVRAIVDNDPKITRDALIDEVHGILKNFIPEMTRIEAMDAISGRGIYHLLPQDALSKTVRDLKTQIRLVAHQMDVVAGKKRPRTGVQRDTMTDAARAEQQALNDLIRRYPTKEKAGPSELPTSLEMYKTRLEHQLADTQAKLDRGDFTRPQKPPPLQLDAKAFADKADLEALKKKLNNEIRKAELANRSGWRKALDFFVRMERAFKLSSPVVFGKLTAAALTRGAETAASETVGGFLSHVPVIAEVARQAPREGGFNVKAMAHGLTEAFTKGMKDAWDTAKTGKSELDLVYGDKLIDRDWLNIFGQLHGALKAPVKRAEFTLALEKRIEHAIRNGVDVTDPMVKTRLCTEALGDAYRSIFMQHGFTSDMFNQFVSLLERSTKYPMAGEISARVMRFLMPVVRVPSNVVAESATGIHGLATASARTMFHTINGTLGHLDPVVADSIMRQFKKGSIGLGLIAIGYFSPQSVGGYDWSEKRKTGTVKTAGFQLYGMDVPRWMTHAPWFELMQFGATIRHVSDHKLRNEETKGVGEGAIAASLGLVKQTPFVNQMLRVDKLFKSSKSRADYAGELAKSTIVPQAVAKAAEVMDPKTRKRNPQTIGQHIEMGIPGLRGNVPLKK